ncbi:hypothetical protein M409DRAFT_16813 [Zasmidium cellare ATCC 36951]|uniref:Cytochrome P450 n=1 Tax=Zasmidium cellare ATCC 36951 TaxID=1080233 RepID=A0A6A6D3Z2_ZASCE|nr:uncharacterized protein M409DRAFT_16813 [Zasmidium cellare ATCC 36951]KAF2172859.1 hypothetical protein M409DRAFT_16813 [Zasmidium cellare ATCC 36951]
MAAFSLAQVGFVALGLLLFKIVYEIIKSYNFARFAKANGCEKPHNVSGSWPFSIINGWQRLFRFMDIVNNGGDVIEDGFGRLFEHANTVQATQFDGSVEIDTIEPANIQAMLATQFKDFGMGKMRINQFYPILGNSIFSSDGSDWEHSRSLFRPQFNREQINDMEETEQAAQQLINALGPTDSTGWTKGTELLPLLYNFTLDTATAFLFGESVNSQAINTSPQHHTNPQETSQAKQFMADFELASEYMMHRIRGQSLYWLADGLPFRRAVRRIRAFTEHFVQRVLDPAAREKAAATTSKKYNLLAALATETQDRTELRNQTLAILIAGRDTTAGLLGWSFERLALHPDVFDKLRAAILRDFPPGGEPITFAKLKACRYLQHFLNEVLRLHPNVPINNRTTTRPTTLPVGGGPTQTSPIALPANRTVTFSVYLLHRRTDLWGPDALDFRPERWGEGKIPAWQFLPFSGGPRICLGQQFALTEAGYVLVRMLQRFEGVEGVGGGERLRKGIGLTMWPAEGVRVRFRRAGGGE